MELQKYSDNSHLTQREALSLETQKSNYIHSQQTVENYSPSYVKNLGASVMGTLPVLAPVIIGTFTHPIIGIISFAPAVAIHAVWGIKNATQTYKRAKNLTTQRTRWVIDRYDRSKFLTPSHEIAPKPVDKSLNGWVKQGIAYITEQLVDTNSKYINPDASNRAYNAIDIMRDLSLKPNDYIVEKSVTPRISTLFKSLFKKQEHVGVIRGSGWVQESHYVYRNFKLVKIEHNLYVNPEVEWERNFTLCLDEEI